MPDTLRVSVVIPVWNAEPYLEALLTAILDQESIIISDIILMDSMSTDGTADIAQRFESVTLVPEPHFNHGATRNRGIERAREETVILMTQDALPEDRMCFHHLTAPLQDELISYTFARQVPYPGTNPMESYYLAEKFPKDAPKIYQTHHEHVRSPDDAFCSNVCAALKTSAWRQHPFREDLIMGEDQEFSCRVQESGCAVAYAPDAVVVHSHNYKLSVLLRRYFDSVVALQQLFPERKLAANASSGIDFLKGEFVFLFKNHPKWLLYYPLYLAAKTTATLVAHVYHEEKLPEKWAARFSMNKSYWR